MYRVVKYAWRAHAVRIVIEFDAAATLETYLKTPTMNKVLFKAQRILPCSFQCLNDSWLLLIPWLDGCDEMRTFIQNFNDFSTAFAICLNTFADSFFVKYIFSLVTSHSTTAATWLTKTSRSREVPITKTAGKLFFNCNHSISCFLSRKWEQALFYQITPALQRSTADCCTLCYV